MKYIITENRMESIIDSYLSKKFHNLEHHVDNFKNFFKGEGVRHLWVDHDEGIPKIIVVYKANEVMGYVRRDIYDELPNLFSLNGNKYVEKYLINWISSHLNINLERIYTFKEHEWKYIY